MTFQLPQETLRDVLTFLNVNELKVISLVNRTFHHLSESVAQMLIRSIISKYLFDDILVGVHVNQSWKSVLWMLTTRVIMFGGGHGNVTKEFCFHPHHRMWEDKYVKLDNPELLFKLVWFKGLVFALNSRVGSSEECNTLQKYNMLTNRWSPGISLPRRLRGASVAVLDESLFVIGGYDKELNRESSAVFVMNGRSSESCVWASAPPLHIARSGHSSTIYRGRIIVAGGRPAGDGDHLHDVEAYDPITRSWELMPPMIKSRYLLTLVIVKDCLYAVGGCEGGSIERYDPRHLRWDYVTRIRGKRNYSCAVAIDSTIFIFGGVSERYEFQPTWDSYNTITCTWESELSGDDAERRRLPWEKFTYGQCIMCPPMEITWT